MKNINISFVKCMFIDSTNSICIEKVSYNSDNKTDTLGFQSDYFLYINMT